MVHDALLVCSMVVPTPTIGPQPPLEAPVSGQSLTRTILSDRLVPGTLTPDSELARRADQGLLQDTTGTLAFLRLGRA